MIIFEGQKIDYAQELSNRIAGGDRVPVFTSNSYITRKGLLVMGRGAAKEVRNQKSFPGLDAIFGRQIDHGSNYGISPVTIAQFAEKGVLTHRLLIMAFQVKNHFKDHASLDLIRVSAMMLRNWAAYKPSLTFVMNYPGIGNGKLTREQVDPVLIEAGLPDNVHLHTV